MKYKYYSHIGFPPINHNEKRKDIHIEIFNNTPYFIKNQLNFNCPQDDFIMSNDKVLIFKLEVITPISGSIIPVDFC